MNLQPSQPQSDEPPPAQGESEFDIDPFEPLNPPASETPEQSDRRNGGRSTGEVAKTTVLEFLLGFAHSVFGWDADLSAEPYIATVAAVPGDTLAVTAELPWNLDP